MNIYIQESLYIDTFLFNLDKLLTQDTTIYNEYFDKIQTRYNYLITNNNTSLTYGFIPACLIDCDYQYKLKIKILVFKPNTNWSFFIYGFKPAKVPLRLFPINPCYIEEAIRNTRGANGIDIIFKNWYPTKIWAQTSIFFKVPLDYCVKANVEDLYQPFRWCLRSRYSVQGLILNVSVSYPNLLVFRISNITNKDVYFLHKAFIQYIPFNQEFINVQFIDHNFIHKLDDRKEKKY